MSFVVREPVKNRGWRIYMLLTCEGKAGWGSREPMLCMQQSTVAFSRRDCKLV